MYIEEPQEADLAAFVRRTMGSEAAQSFADTGFAVAWITPQSGHTINGRFELRIACAKCNHWLAWGVDAADYADMKRLGMFTDFEAFCLWEFGSFCPDILPYLAANGAEVVFRKKEGPAASPTILLRCVGCGAEVTSTFEDKACPRCGDDTVVFRCVCGCGEEGCVPCLNKSAGHDWKVAANLRENEQ